MNLYICIFNSFIEFGRIMAFFSFNGYKAAKMENKIYLSRYRFLFLFLLLAKNENEQRLSSLEYHL